MTELGVEHADVVEHPRYGLVVVRALERAEAVGVASFGGDEVAAHVEEDAPVLLDHSEKADIARFPRKLRGLRVELLALDEIAAALRDDGEAIEPVRLAADRAALLGVNQTLRVAAIGGLGFALLAVKRALPP